MRRILITLTLLVCAGCGGGSGSGSNTTGSGGGGTSQPQFTPVNVQGQYAIEATSSTITNAVELIEVNFTQTSTTVFASKGNVVLIGGTLDPTTNMITLQSVGGACDNHVIGDDSLQGNFSSATQATITFSENNSGTATATATFSADGSQIVSGTYSFPAQCSYPADSGTLVGKKVPPISGSYAGMLTTNAFGTQPFIVTISQSGLNITVTGTMGGTQFTMTGSVVGATFEATGTIAGQTMEALGLYDFVGNDILVYDNAGNYLGQLKPGTNPQAASKSAVHLKAADFLRIDHVNN